MSDYIDKQAAIDALKGLPTWYGDAGCLPFGDPQPPMEALLYPEDAISAIENLPSADVEPVRRGKWIVSPREEWETFDECICSVCNAVEYFNVGWKKFSYCPNCGARMDGEQDG